MPSKALKETVAARMDSLYGWKVKPGAVVAVTGIVSGFTVAARAFCTPKKGVLLQTPVYNEFHEVKTNVGIPQLDAPFIKNINGNILSYEIDWGVFEKRVRKAGMSCYAIRIIRWASFSPATNCCAWRKSASRTTC